MASNVKALSGGAGVRDLIKTPAPEQISSALSYEFHVIHEAVTGRQQDKFLNAVWNRLDKNLGDYMDAKARTDRARLHHVYEWGAVGTSPGRLFRIHRRVSPNGFRVAYNFVQSRRVAPIAPILRVPGPTGRVVTKTAVFKNKARVMEEGTPVIVRRRTAKFLAIPATSVRGYSNNRGIVFTKGPVTVRYPGGLATKAGFARTINGYFQSGLAMRELKASGVLDKPLKVIRRASGNIPVTISRAKFNQKISGDTAKRMAQYRVLQESQGVY
jgi:hypothetical protein